MTKNKIICDEIRKQLAGKQGKTRFAPSPTGYLHLGHIASAIYVWGIAQAIGAEVILRLEDHDQGRFRPEFAHAIIEDLAWLGFIPPLSLESFASSFHQQSFCLHFYKQALGALPQESLFLCGCSRRDIRQAAPAPQQEEIPYSGHCEALALKQGNSPLNLRFRHRDYDYTFSDARLGKQTQNPFLQQRASIVKDKNDNWSYQFAVVVDDIRDGINVVVRGEDILTSTGRQMDLYHALHADTPIYMHHPLIRDDSGKKLSKRFLSEGVRNLRLQNITPETVLGEAAFAVGLQKTSSPLSAKELGNLFTK